MTTHGSLLAPSRSLVPSRSFGSTAQSFDYTYRDFSEIANLLRSATGIDLQPTKLNLVHSRLARRLRAMGLRSFSAYCDLVRTDDGERRRMIEALTTNTTSFFREQHHFDYLQQFVLKPLIERAQMRMPARIWSCASSSGPEPYSIALTILSLAPEAASLDIRVLATDVNSQMVERGAAGTYRRDEIDGVPPSLLTRYFEHDSAGSREQFVATNELKSMIVFRQLNLMERWPMKREFDVVFCRNVMIYFSPETQATLWDRIAERISVGGYLFIGHSERLTGSCVKQFEPVGLTAYRKHK